MKQLVPLVILFALGNTINGMNDSILNALSNAQKSIKKDEINNSRLTLDQNSYISNQKESINWDIYKKAFTLWLSKEGKLASDIYWNPLKKGIESQQVRFNTIMDCIHNPERVGFIAYTGSLNNEDKTICLLISPSWMYSPIMGRAIVAKGMLAVLRNPEWKKAYAISFITDLSFPSLGFDECTFTSESSKLKNSKLLPKHLHPKKGIMPGWKNPMAFKVWVQDAESIEDKEVSYDDKRLESK